MDLHEMRTLVEACTYKPGWIISFNAGEKRFLPDAAGGTFMYDRPYIQVSVTDEAEASMLASGPNKYEREPWAGDKRYLSHFMCRQEIVGVVEDAIKAAELHEFSEWFRYKGAAIRNQHLDPDALVEVAKHAKNFNVRANAMTMQENTLGS